jgi:putative NADH-flavin reductase
MKLTVFGATGGTGEEIVRQASSDGHTVTAVVRRPDAVRKFGDGVRVVRGDVTDASSIRGALDGSEAVLSALGSRSLGTPTNVYSDGIANVIAAMREAGVRRLLCVSAVPVGRDSPGHNVVERYLAFPILYRFFGEAYTDMKRMEDIVERSDRDWTVFRPPQLVDGTATGTYRTAIDAPLPWEFRISRADLAAAMLAALNDPVTIGHRMTIAY